jgi:hypothetical protein
MLPPIVGVVVLLFVFVLLAFLVLVVVLPYSRESDSNPADSAEAALTGIFAFLAVWVPATASQLFTDLQNHFTKNYKWWLLLLAVVGISYGVYNDQAAYDKVADGFWNAVVLPFFNKFVFPIGNMARMSFNGFIGTMNVAANIGRIVWNQLVDITLDCDAMNWGAIPVHFGSFALALSNSTTDFILTGGASDFQSGVAFKHYANGLSELNPLFDCQCRDANFLWPILLHPTYGIIQSPRLHYFPQTVLNLALESARVPVNATFGIIERISDGCPDRACEVARSPKFLRSADLACQVLTHGFGFIDDAFYSTDEAISAVLGLSIPWVRPPRVFGLMAMPFCAITDVTYGLADVVFHFDLFFTLPSTGEGMYAAEFPTELVMSRFHNMTYQIEQIGADISGNFPTNFGRLIGRALNILVSLFEFVLIAFRRLFATRFEDDAIKNLMGTAPIQAIVDSMEADVVVLQASLVALEDEIGEILTPTIFGISEIVMAVTQIVREFTQFKDNILSYFGGQVGNLQGGINRIYGGVNVLAGVSGNSIRRLGAFGDVQCGSRDLTMDPSSLERVELESMNLNLMCAIGTLLEMWIRVFIVISQHVVDGSLFVVRTVAGLGLGTFDFRTGIRDAFVDDSPPNTAPFDIGRENGYFEAQCLVSDSVAMIIPSLLTLAPDTIACPNGGPPVADRFYNLFRAIVRLTLLTPAMLVRAVFQTWTLFLCDGASCLTFEAICDKFLTPRWMLVAVPTATVVIGLIDTVDCFVDTDGTLDDISLAIGVAFIDQSYSLGYEIITPCTALSNDIDGGVVVGAICGFAETITDIITIFSAIFKDGFFPALWNLISGPIFEIIEQVVAIAECVWDQVTALFDKLGNCGEALGDLGDLFTDLPGYIETIEDECGDWGNVFGTCAFTFTVPEFTSGSGLPNSQSGNTGGNPNPSVIQLPDSAVFGSCINPMGTCAQRPALTLAGFYKDFDSNDCSSAGIGANTFVPGIACIDVNITAARASFGACCVPNADCVEVDFETCQNTTVGLGVKAVWSRDQSCTAMNADCVLQSPSQYGCCLTDYLKGIFDTNVRYPRPGINAEDCYSTSVAVRPYYVPADSTCALIQANPLYGFLLNTSDAVLDDLLLSPIAAAGDIEHRPCTPEESIYATTANKLWNSACVVQYFSNPPLAGLPPLQPVLGVPNEASIKIAGTGYTTEGFGAYWTCRSDTDWYRANTLTGAVEICNGCCNLPGFCELNADGLIDSYNMGDDLFLNYWNVIDTFPTSGPDITTPFADPVFMWSQGIAVRETSLNGDFIIQCRYVYLEVVSNDLFISFGPFTTVFNIESALGKADCTGIPDLGGAQCYTSDCRFRAYPATTPLFDNAFPHPYFPYTVARDAVSSTGRSMGLLYFVGGDINLGADVTGARCDLFAPVPITNSAPDVYVARRLLSFDDEPLGMLEAALAFQQAAPVLINDTAHPCYEVYALKVMDNSSAQMNYVLDSFMKDCLRSNFWAYFLEGTFLLHNSAVAGYRIIDPHFLFKGEVWDRTWMNFGRGIIRGFAYSSHIYKLSTNNTNATLPTWAEFAYDNNVRDRLGLRVGGFTAMLGQMTLVHDLLGLRIPTGLGVFGSMLSVSRWQASTQTNGTRVRRIANETNPPLFSDLGWEMWENFVTFNWMNGTENMNFTESSLRVQRLRALQNFTSDVATSALIARGMLPATQALRRNSCDPRDRSCLDCELVVGSAETFVDLVLNTVEDMKNSKRFTINIEEVDLTRTNTFLQPGDALACRDPEPVDIDNFFVTAIFNITDYLAGQGEGFARHWMGRFVCYATNFNREDPHSVFLYLEKFRSCDPINDGSASRGRAGVGLRTAAIAVTIGLLVILFVASFCVPLPTAWITVAIWLSLVGMAAYWWSPACLVGRPPIVLPVLPDALADDLYVELRNLVPRNCTQYDESVAWPAGCPIEGRTFVDCKEYGFDYLGGKHLAYMLYSINETWPEAIRDTSVPVLSSIMQTPYYNTAFSDLKRVHGTPIGKFCFGLEPLSPAKLFPLVFAILQASLSTSLLFVPLAFAFLALALIGLFAILLARTVALLRPSISSLTRSR